MNRIIFQVINEMMISCNIPQKRVQRNTHILLSLIEINSLLSFSRSYLLFSLYS